MAKNQRCRGGESHLAFTVSVGDGSSEVFYGYSSLEFHFWKFQAEPNARNTISGHTVPGGGNPGGGNVWSYHPNVDFGEFVLFIFYGFFIHLRNIKTVKTCVRPLHCRDRGGEKSVFTLSCHLLTLTMLQPPKPSRQKVVSWCKIIKVTDFSHENSIQASGYCARIAFSHTSRGGEHKVGVRSAHTMHVPYASVHHVF